MRLDTNALWKATGVGAAVVLVLTLLSQIPFVGLLFCCVLWLSYVGIGALYGVFARRNGTPISAGPAALGGAIAAALAGIVQGIISALVTTVFTSTEALTEALNQLEGQGFEVPPEFYDVYTTPGFAIATALMSICFAFFIAAIMGAIGGAIYGATQRTEPPAPTYTPYGQGPPGPFDELQPPAAPLEQEPPASPDEPEPPEPPEPYE